MCRHGRTDGGGAEVDDLQVFLRFADRLDFIGDREAPAVEFLAEGHRNSVLQVGATHLQNTLEFFALLVEGGNEVFNRLQKHVAPEHQRKVQSRRIRVVGGLTEVGVVVRGNALVVALDGTQLFSSEVADHFVAVHVRGRTGTALEPVGHKLITVLAGDQLIARPDESVGDISRNRAEFLVGHGGSLLDIAEGDDKEGFLAHRHFRDVEVLLAAQRLHAVVAIIRYFQIAQKIVFNTRHLLQLLFRSGQSAKKTCPLPVKNASVRLRAGVSTSPARGPDGPSRRKNCCLTPKQNSLSLPFEPHTTPYFLYWCKSFLLKLGIRTSVKHHKHNGLFL